MNTPSSSFFSKSILYFWNWLVQHFSLRKLTYIALLLSISIAFIYQTVSTYPEITRSHPYSDVLIYQDLGNGNRSFYGTTHITHRVLFPLLLSLFSAFPQYLLPFLTAFFHLSLLVFVLLRVFKQKDGLSLTLFSIVLISLSSFWRGFFLPMPDTLLWAFLTLFWLECIKEKPSYLLLLALFLGAIFTKELALLSLVFVLFTFKLTHYKKVLPVFAASLVYIATDFYFSQSYSSNYIFSPDLWSADWFKNVLNESIWIPKYLLSGFSFILIFWLFRIYVAKSYFLKDILPEILLFVIIFLFAATNSPRILFPFTGIMAIRLMQKEYFNL